MFSLRDLHSLLTSRYSWLSRYKIIPRKLFRQVLLGMEEKVQESIPEIYSCLLCRMCEEYCPANVHIAENMRYLRKYLNENQFKLL